MSENAMIQKAARAQISGFAGAAMLATLIMLAINGAAGSLYGLALLIAGPMGVGYVRYCMKVMDERQSDYNRLFSGFNNFVNTMVAGLLYSIAVCVGYVLLIVPGIIVWCGFSMTYMIMAEDDKIGGVDALKMSWEMMRGHKWEFFCLSFRFIGWLLLSILTLGILSLWVKPWMQMSYINFYRKLKYGEY